MTVTTEANKNRPTQTTRITNTTGPNLGGVPPIQFGKHNAMTNFDIHQIRVASAIHLSLLMFGLAIVGDIRLCLQPSVRRIYSLFIFSRIRVPILFAFRYKKLCVERGLIFELFGGSL